MSHQNLFQNTVTTILVVCAVLIAIVALHREFFVQEDPPYVSGHVSEWKGLLVGRQTNLGKETAPLKIIEFSDYQCPYCKGLEPSLQSLIKGHHGQLALIRYDLPLVNIHKQAMKAAIAARCAAVQGVYEPFEEKIFQNNAHLAKLNWDELATTARVPDIAMFSSCLQQRKTATLVSADMAVAARLGINATPVLVINGDVISGTYDKQSLSKVISYELARD